MEIGMSDIERLIAWAKKASTCIYIAVEESVADDISSHLKEIIAALEAAPIQGVERPVVEGWNLPPWDHFSIDKRNEIAMFILSIRDTKLTVYKEVWENLRVVVGTLSASSVTVVDRNGVLEGKGELCSDCPPANYPTEKTRCNQCPLRALSTPPEAGKEGGAFTGNGTRIKPAPDV
jgi:hypothetical protein